MAKAPMSMKKKMMKYEASAEDIKEDKSGMKKPGKAAAKGKGKGKGKVPAFLMGKKGM